jgi:hypothetical protein
MKDEKLQFEMNQKVLKQSSEQNYFSQYLNKTLESFFYRYFDEVKSLGTNSWCSLESQMVQALKTPDLKAQEGIKQLARAIAKKDNPSVMRKISCNWGEITSSGKGTLKIITALSWDHPGHSFHFQTSVTRETLFSFDDGLHFRNQLALNLEKAFSLF